MHITNIHDAKARLSQLIKRALAGEEAAHDDDRRIRNSLRRIITALGRQGHLEPGIVLRYL